MQRLPEELIERILVLSSDSNHPAPSITPTFLLISRQLNRIATPLLYAHLSLHSAYQASPVARTLSTRAEYAACVRRLTLAGTWSGIADVLQALGEGTKLDVLDLTIDAGKSVEDLEKLVSGLLALSSVRQLVVRKAQGVYLSLPKAKSVIAAIAKAIPHWSHLETVTIAFKLSDDFTSPLSLLSTPKPDSLPPTPTATTSPPTPTSSPCRALAHALSRAPALHTIMIALPAIWNPLLLIASASPSLQRIVLDPVEDSTTGAWIPGQGVFGTALYIVQAKKHARLAELIRAGTPTIRPRPTMLESMMALAVARRPSAPAYMSRRRSCFDAPGSGRRLSQV